MLNWPCTSFESHLPLVSQLVDRRLSRYNKSSDPLLDSCYEALSRLFQAGLHESYRNTDWTSTVIKRLFGSLGPPKSGISRLSTGISSLGLLHRRLGDALQTEISSYWLAKSSSTTVRPLGLLWNFSTSQIGMSLSLFKTADLCSSQNCFAPRYFHYLSHRSRWYVWYVQW